MPWESVWMHLSLPFVCPSPPPPCHVIVVPSGWRQVFLSVSQKFQGPVPSVFTLTCETLLQMERLLCLNSLLCLGHICRRRFIVEIQLLAHFPGTHIHAFA